MNARKHLSYFGYVLPKLSFNAFRAADDAPDFLGQNGSLTRCYTTWPTSESVVNAWNGLARSAPNATAFHTPAWQHGVGRAYARVGRWRLITLSQGEQLIGTLPLTLTQNGVLETPGEMISDYLDPLVSGVDQESAWHSILEMVKKHPGEPIRELKLHNMRNDAASVAALRQVSGRCGFELLDEDASAASRIALPATWDDFLAGLGGHDRKELRRKMRNADKVGARLEIHETESEVLTDLDRIFGQMRGVGGAKGIKAQWVYRPLFKRAAPELLRHRRICTYNLMLNDQPAAGLICFPSQDGPMMWAGGWDKELAKHSPGIVLFGMAIQDSILKGHRHLDLLRGQSRYKGELGAADYGLKRITLRRSA